MKILIIRLSSIGDIILTTPVVRCVKTKYPNAEIHYCTKKNYTPLLEYNPYVDRIIPFEKSLKSLIREIKKESYDYVIDLHHNVRTLRIKLALPNRTAVYSFRKMNIRKLIAVKFHLSTILPRIHIVDRYMAACKNLDVKNDQQGLDYFFPPDFTIEPLPEKFSDKYIALVIGAQFQTKQLPVYKLIEVCQKSPYSQFVIVGGTEDIERGEEIVSKCPNALNVCGKYSLHGSAALVKNASLVITNDTGMMHIAAAFNKKIISIWGNTIPEFGMYPYLPVHPSFFSIHEVKNLSCRPCSKIGYKKCPRGHFNCMEKQNVEKIVEDINSFS